VNACFIAKEHTASGTACRKKHSKTENKLELPQIWSALRRRQNKASSSISNPAVGLPTTVSGPFF
jgi:hypothetical protein